MLRAKAPVATSVRGTGRLVDLPAVAQRLKALRTGPAGIAVFAGEAAIRPPRGVATTARMPRVSGDPAASSLLWRATQPPSAAWRSPSMCRYSRPTPRRVHHLHRRRTRRHLQRAHIRGHQSTLGPGLVRNFSDRDQRTSRSLPCGSDRCQSAAQVKTLDRPPGSDPKNARASSCRRCPCGVSVRLSLRYLVALQHNYRSGLRGEGVSGLYEGLGPD
jgi:hypothetical protein